LQAEDEYTKGIQTDLKKKVKGVSKRVIELETV